jgi:hypothetical protein
MVLVHYDDLLADLDGGMRRLSAELGIAVDEARWPGLVRAATFDEMRAASAIFDPDHEGLFKDTDAFLRHGVSGDGRGLLSAEEVRRYEARAAALAPADLLAWLHHDGEP